MDEITTMQNISSCTYSTKDYKYDFLSNDAKDLIKLFLEIDPDKRVTISDALNHQWIKNGISIKIN